MLKIFPIPKVDYPEIAEGIFPRHRFMSAYEQKVDLFGFFLVETFILYNLSKVEPPDRKWQYLLFAAEPYETIAFKVDPNLWSRVHHCNKMSISVYPIYNQVPSREVDKSEQRFWSHWNKETKEFFLQFSFKLSDPRNLGGAPRPPPPAMVYNLTSNLTFSTTTQCQ